jgi:hypothetical protein
MSKIIIISDHSNIGSGYPYFKLVIRVTISIIPYRTALVFPSTERLILDGLHYREPVAARGKLVEQRLESDVMTLAANRHPN